MSKVILICALLLSGCYEDQQRKEMALLGCTYTHTETMPEQVYCGKACFKNKRREHYSCPNGSRTWFDH